MSFRFTRAMGRERVTRETQQATRSLLFVAFVFLSSFARDRSCVSANSIARNERNEKVGVFFLESSFTDFTYFSLSTYLLYHYIN